MEFTPHKYICQQSYLHKLNRGIVHRAVNRIMGLQDQLHDASHKIENIVCSEPSNFCQWNDETGRKVAYGRNAIPRLRKEISHSNQNIASCAIRQLTDLVHDPEIAIEALKMNIVARFPKTLKSENIILQERSLACIKVLSNQPAGMSYIIKNPLIIENIRKCILHPNSPAVRKQAAITVNALAQNYIAVRTLVEAAFVKVLMQNLIEAMNYSEKNNPLNFRSMVHVTDMMVLHLDTLDLLLDDSDQPKVQAIAYDAFLLAPLLTKDCIRLKKASASFFSQIAKHSIGKDGIYNHGLIIPLCQEFMNYQDPETMARLANVLQFAIIHKEARKQAFGTNLFQFLSQLVTRDNISHGLKLSALKMLTLFAEIPEGRELIKSLIKSRSCTITVKLDGTTTMLNVVRELVKEIMWKP